ncbi:MAG: DUF4276 family protein [Myxococcales bacterium]|nr:DUF4276 family protein [Myxococcales bacterium]
MRLVIVVEGQTEEAFVKQLLAPHLAAHGVYASTTIVGKLTAQKRGHRGRGGGHFRHWRKDIARILGGDSSGSLRVSTIFDLYGLPVDFPGLELHGADTDTARRCESLQDALAAEFDDPRLIPYLQRHEFESLVLASLPSLRAVLDAQDDLDGLTRLEASLVGTSPEDINDGKTTAPSKRLTAHVPGYRKTLHGPLVTSETGLSSLRRQCPRFHAWMTKLESLSTVGAESDESSPPHH